MSKTSITAKQIAERLRKKGKYWYVRVHSKTSGTRLISTKCTNSTEAMESVRESKVLELEQAHRVNGLTHSVIGYLTSGRRVTVDSAIEAYVQAMASSRLDKHRHNTLACLHQWVAATKIGNLNPSAVTDEHVSTFVNDGSDAKASTRKLRLSYIRKFMDYCRESGSTSRNVARMVVVNLRVLSHAQKEAKHVGYYTKWEVDDIITGIQKEMLTTFNISELADLVFWERAVSLAFASGLRFGDVVNLEWASFGEVIAVHTAKTGARVTPNPSEIKKILHGIPKDGKYIFPEQHEIYSDVNRRSNFSVWFRRLCKKLDMPYKGLHALRHGHATALHRAGSDVQAVANALGHAKVGTTETYIHR